MLLDLLRYSLYALAGILDELAGFLGIWPAITGAVACSGNMGDADGQDGGDDAGLHVEGRFDLVNCAALRGAWVHVMSTAL